MYPGFVTITHIARHKKSNELTHESPKQVGNNISLFIQMDRNECLSELLILSTEQAKLNRCLLKIEIFSGALIETLTSLSQIKFRYIESSLICKV